MTAMTVIIACIGSPATAQLVFIPDLQMRSWLNTNVPGVVDGAGYMNTAHPGIGSFTNGTLEVWFGMTDLTGLEYCTGLMDLDMLFIDQPNIWPGFPPNLQVVTISAYGGSAVPAWPTSLIALNMLGCTGLTSLPVFPVSLQQLDLTAMNTLQSLPMLPAGLVSIDLETMPMLGSLPALPSGTEYLSVHEAPLLSMLPSLPGGLETLSLQAIAVTGLPSLPSLLHTCALRSLPNLLQLPTWPSAISDIFLTDLPMVTTLPPLPNTTTHLGLEVLPQLSAWPVWPPALTGLSIGSLPFPGIPPLPATLSELTVSGSPGWTWLPPLPAGLMSLQVVLWPSLTVFPALPQQLTSLWLEGLPSLGSLPTLPADLLELYLIDCDAVPCLPDLPDYLLELTVYSSTIQCLPEPLGPWVFPDLTFDENDICPTPCASSSPLLGGRIFHDQNGNGTMDAGEPALPGGVVTVQPGGMMLGSDANGRYASNVAQGTYSLSSQFPGPYPQTVLPTVQTALLAQFTDVDTTLDFGIALDPGHHDLRTELLASPARPGFHNVAWVIVTNVGTEPLAGTAQVNIDADQSLVGAVPAPQSLVGQTAVWNLPFLLPGENWSATLDLTTDASVPIGTAVMHTAEATGSVSDETPADNEALWSTVVVGSYDPNDKTVLPSQLTVGELANGAEVSYTIRFQNTGTYPAVRVVVFDTLSTSLQWNTMRFIASSHACTWSLVNGVLRFTFDPILLPDSISDEQASHGFVQFVMKPLSNLLPGDVVQNHAAIVFDYNTPIVTNSAFLTITTGTGLAAQQGDGIQLGPNPATNEVWITSDLEDALLEVFDIRGSEVIEMRSNKGMTRIPLSGIPAGVYEVRVTGTSGVGHGRFIKQ